MLFMIEHGVFFLRMSAIEHEIASSACALAAGGGASPRALPSSYRPPGSRLAVIGCGTSLYMAQAYAAAREAAGAGETDAFPASEFPPGRGYDAVLAISRSGTTTEVVRALATLPRTGPGVRGRRRRGHARRELGRDTASCSTSPTRRPSSRRVSQRRPSSSSSPASGSTPSQPPRKPSSPSREALPAGSEAADSFVFLGRGWTVGLANEAALKLREAALVPAESYPALEYRHGPIALATTDTVVWPLGDVDGDLLADVRAAGAGVVRDRPPSRSPTSCSSTASRSR